MADSVEVRKCLYLTGPRAYGAAGPPGQCMVIPVTTSAVVVDLTQATFGLTYQEYDMQAISGSGAPPGQPQGLVGSFISIYADGADLGVNIGSTLASVTGGNVPALATQGSISSVGIYTGAAGTCWRIPNGANMRIALMIGIDLFMGIIASTSGSARVYQSSAFGYSA